MGYALINGRWETVLINSGARGNAVAPWYVKQHGLKVGPVSDLASNPTLISVSGIGGHMTALGYIIFNIQIEGIPSYREDQVALVIEDLSGMGQRVPIILGMPTIHHVCCQMKELEIQSMPEEWQHAIISYNAAQHILVNSLSVGTEKKKLYPTSTGKIPTDLDELVLLDKNVIIPAFSSKIVTARMKQTFMTKHRLNVMVQVPYPEDEAKLPVGLYVQRVYMELHVGSKGLSMVIWNGTGKPIHLVAGRTIRQVVAANIVPDAVAKLQEDDAKTIPLSSEQCQNLLMEALQQGGNLGNLDSWPRKTALKVKQLLMEFHHIFSLEPKEIGSTDAMEHMIELWPEQDKPFKERFQHIAPHEVEEVRQHLQEMLDGGAI